LRLRLSNRAALRGRSRGGIPRGLQVQGKIVAFLALITAREPAVFFQAKQVERSPVCAPHAIIGAAFEVRRRSIANRARNKM
jgi:hypothetical protein